LKGSARESRTLQVYRPDQAPRGHVDLLDLDFLFVVGKGGVGKTTTSAALALAAAQRGKRVLVAMCNAKERLSYLLEVAPIGPHNQTIMEGVDAVNMVPKVALEEYGLMILKVKSLYKAIFENRFMAAFLRGTPGLEAWTMLGKAYYHTTELDPQGRRRYDLVIVDAPATGHALDMLRVPQVLTEVAPPSLLRREAENALHLFRDPDRAGVVLVTLPEDMPTNETLELREALRTQLRMPLQRLVINGVLPRIFSEEERQRVLQLPALLEAHSPLSSMARAGRLRAIRERIQADNMQRLKAGIDAPQTSLPWLFVPSFRHAAIDSLARAFV
jgi:anion-transporting  ArsA/GET3 family ATPase